MVGLQIPFSIDYDPQSIGGNPPPDVDLATLHHEIDPANSAGGRFTVVLNGVDFNGFPRYSLVVDNGGPVLLDYEALQTPADNQYQVVVNSYDAPGGTLVAVRQFTILLNDIVNEAIVPVNAPTDINWNGVRPSETALPGSAVVIANLSTVDVDNSAVTWSKIGGDASIVVSAAGIVSRTGGLAANSLYTLQVKAEESANPGISVNEAITIRTGTTGNNNGVAGALNGSGLTDVIYALAGNDQLNGLGGNDTLFGQDGNDTLNGGTGNDDLTGGDDNDTINGGDGDDTIRYTIGDDSDTVNGGANNDTLIITGTGGSETLDVVFNGTSLTNFEGGTVTASSRLRADLSGGTGDFLDYNGTAAAVTVDLGAGTASGFSSISNIENVRGGDGNDILISAAGVNNALTGNDGNDTFTVHDAGDTVSELNGAGGGVDTVLAGFTYTINDTDVENLTLTGTANINGTGNTSANVLTGNSGNNTLNGSGGTDTAVLAGAVGTLTFGLSGTTLTVASAADGTDTLQSIETLRIGGVNYGLVAGTNAANNNLNGVNGAAGSQIVLGFDGIDSINGGTGNDIIFAGAGNDIINYAIGGGVDIIDGGANTDTLNITDGGANNTLDVLYNGTAISSVEGGAITSIETINVNMGGASDTISFAGSTSGVTVNLAAAAGTSGITSLLSVLNAVGTAQADTLTGGTGANTLTGGGGVDTINGGAGGDILIGGDGADVINTGAADDNVLDVIRFSATSEFGDTVSNFDANGTADRVEFGGALNTAYDDGNSDDNFSFSSGNGSAGTVTVTVGQANANAEALLLTGVGGEGVTNANLTNAASVSAAFNAEFNITASNGEDALLVINDTDGNSFAVYQWIQAGGGETSAAELTLIGTFAANAQITTASFDFV